MAMPARSHRALTISINTCELSPLLAEIAERVRVLGADEAARRIGCEMDEAFFRSLVSVELIDGESARAVATPEFDRVIAALW